MIRVENDRGGWSETIESGSFWLPLSWFHSKGHTMGFILFALIFISAAWFLHEPRPKMAFAVSEARLRIDGAYAVRANNL